MDQAREHICVCICTYKRPKLLERLLNELQNQVTEDLFTYSVVVVDNDSSLSAKTIVGFFKKRLSINIDYYSEPEKNIALARNKAVENAKGDFIAFIDDDEFPLYNWLLNFYKAYKSFKADGILGPVLPHFSEETPKWLVKGKFCERHSHKTGTILHWDQTRTGNVLLCRELFKEPHQRFEACYGSTGGEDIEFFKKRIEEGHIFIWCNEATVYEVSTEERWKKRFYIKKYLRIGGLTGEKVRKGPILYFKCLPKAMLAFVLYMSLLPFSIFLGEHRYMKALTKGAYYFGLMSGFCGWIPIRFRDDG